MALQTLDIQRRSATTTPSPGVRQTTEVAKLIDISKCIGCKACQTACMEWNDIRDEVGSNAGTYDNPRDLTENSWTVMRYSEVEVEQGKLEWLIRKDSESGPWHPPGLSPYRSCGLDTRFPGRQLTRFVGWWRKRMSST